MYVHLCSTEECSSFDTMSKDFPTVWNVINDFLRFTRSLSQYQLVKFTRDLWCISQALQLVTAMKRTSMHMMSL